MSKLTVTQRVQKAHIWLMNHPKYCVYSGIIMLGNVTVDNSVATAATNGRDVAYGEAFCSTLLDKELRGLILHENLHKAFSHLHTWQNLWKVDPKRANMACDYVINLMIVDSDPTAIEVALHKGWCFDVAYRGMDAHQVFDLLEKKGNRGGAGEEQGQEGAGLDDHRWEDANKLSDAEKQVLAKNVEEGLRQGVILASKMSGGVPKEVADALEPTVDWREVLRDFVSSCCVGHDESTWRRPSRRWVSQDVYMPSTISESLGRIIVAADLSGSMWGELPRLLGEVKSICESVRPEGLDLLYWDTKVCKHEKYELAELDSVLGTTKPAGGGGTDPQCVVDYIHSERLTAECVIVLTDGVVSSWGRGWPYPVFWGITSKNIKSPVGTSVFVG